MPLDRSWFIQSRRGNIKDQYFFEKKLGSGGYGAVYLAMNKQTGKAMSSTCLYSFILDLQTLTYRNNFAYRSQSGRQSHAEGQDSGL